MKIADKDKHYKETTHSAVEGRSSNGWFEKDMYKEAALQRPVSGRATSKAVSRVSQSWTNLRNKEGLYI